VFGSRDNDVEYSIQDRLREARASKLGRIGAWIIFLGALTPWQFGISKVFNPAARRTGGSLESHNVWNIQWGFEKTIAFTVLINALLIYLFLRQETKEREKHLVFIASGLLLLFCLLVPLLSRPYSIAHGAIGLGVVIAAFGIVPQMIASFRALPPAEIGKVLVQMIRRRAEEEVQQDVAEATRKSHTSE